MLCLGSSHHRRPSALETDLAHTIEVEQRIKEGAERMRRAAQGNKRVTR